MPRTLPGITTFGLVACLCAQSSPPAGFTYETLVDGPLQSVTAMAFAPDGRLFLAERETGNIRIYENGQLQAAPWASVSVTSHGPWAEAGLLGIAIDPDFLHNRYVYVFHTINSENVIARFEEVGGQGTNYTVLTPPGAIESVAYHNGGNMVFGHDGTLFVGTGDRLNGQLAQDPQSWNGKVLRFDVPNLTIPATNPTPGSPVWSMGHRNGFGLCVHPVTGEVFQTENGSSLMDEVNRIVPGGNYGWPLIEGREVNPNPAFDDPLSWYQPTTALTGCAFYFGENYPVSYQNAWFFTDYNQNKLRTMTLDATGQAVLSQSVFHDQPGSGYTVTMGPDGNLWYLTHDTGGYGADELGRYVHVNEPMPSAHVMAVSNRSVGGTITVGVHSNNGDLVVPWLSWSRYSVPVPTPFGNQWVPVDSVLPVIIVAGDDRGYVGVSVPNDASIVGFAVFLQAAAYTPATGAIAQTNPAKHILRR